MTFDELLALHPDVSRETFEDLTTYADLLRKWNRSINLVAQNTLADLWTRHIRDSLQLLPLLPQNAARLVDIGSGAGFPGLVLAMAARRRPSPLKVTLVDSDQRKCEFLRTVSRTVGVETTVIAGRVDDVPAQFCDVMTARALAPLDVLLGYAVLHLAPTGIALFLKGETAEREIESARQSWAFDLVARPSLTNPQARVLKIGDIRRV